MIALSPLVAERWLDPRTILFPPRGILHWDARYFFLTGASPAILFFSPQGPIPVCPAAALPPAESSKQWPARIWAARAAWRFGSMGKIGRRDFHRRRLTTQRIEPCPSDPKDSPPTIRTGFWITSVRGGRWRRAKAAWSRSMRGLVIRAKTPRQHSPDLLFASPVVPQQNGRQSNIAAIAARMTIRPSRIRTFSPQPSEIRTAGRVAPRQALTAAAAIAPAARLGAFARPNGVG
jgi:hypothetical protein